VLGEQCGWTWISAMRTISKHSNATLASAAWASRTSWRRRTPSFHVGVAIGSTRTVVASVVDRS
jgi:hypothetical protein